MKDSPAPRFSPLVLLVAAVAAVLAAGLGGVAAHRTTGPYRSTALVSIDQPLAIAAASNGGAIEKLSGIRLKYTGLVPTDRLAIPVAELLSVPISQVRGRLSATVVASDLLLRLTCAEPDPELSRRCADALAGALVSYVEREQTAFAIPVAQRLLMSPVQMAGPGFRPTRGLSRPLGVAALGGGLAAAVVLALASRQRS